MRRIRNLLLSASLCALSAASIGGCSGSSGGGGESVAPAQSGEITVAVTDAATDEIDTFEVDIVSFKFDRRSGATVEVLPQTTRVDFAQLVTVSEVVAAATIPVGHYERAFITLDFSSAAVRITGNTSGASLRDAQGQPLTGQRELEIVFPNGGFTVGRGKGHFAEVDFDLDNSLVVDAAANTVTVDTILFASIDPLNPKDARVPGLASNFSGSGFDLDVRIGLGLVSRGVLSVRTEGSTVFDLQGQVLTGQAGHDALEALGDGTLIVAGGRVNPLLRTLAAQWVVLLPQNLDEVGGLVVARSGAPGANPTITLKGIAVRRANGSVSFNDTVTLLASFVETKVNKRGTAGGTLNTDSINVGQRILAYGTFSGSVLDLSQPGAGFVRLVETDLNGEVVGTPTPGRLALDLERIGRRLQPAFDFTVDGIAQADPDAMIVDTGGLSLAGVQSSSAVQVRGFVAPVTTDAAAEPDFVADTVIDRTGAGSHLRMGWLPATANPIVSSTTGELTLDHGSALVAAVDRGLIVPTQLAADPTVSGTTNGFYAVRRGLTVTLFRDFAAFLAHFEAEINAGARTYAFRALGRWDATTNRLTAVRAVAIMR